MSHFEREILTFSLLEAQKKKMDRNLQQVNNLAKFNESDIKKESHVLQFIPQILDSKQVKLLEVSKGTLEYIKSGER